MSTRKGPRRSAPNGPSQLTSERIAELSAQMLDEQLEFGPLDRQDLRFALAELASHRREAEKAVVEVASADIAADGVIVATDVQIEKAEAA